MSWLLFAIFSAILFGIAQVFIKKGLATFSPLWNCIIDGLFSVIIYIPLALFLGVTFNFTLWQFFVITIICSLYLFLYYAIDKAQISLSGTIFAMYPVATVILSYIFLSEPVTMLQYGLIALILVGGALISYQPEHGKKAKELFKKNWLLWALFGAFATGLGDFLAKVSLHSVDVNSYLFLFGLAFPISIVIFWIFDKKGRELPKKINSGKLIWTLLGTLMLSLGVICITFAFAYGYASLVSVISTVYIAIMVLLAYFFLHEKITARQLIGIILMFIGVLLIGI